MPTFLSSAWFARLGQLQDAQRRGPQRQERPGPEMLLAATSQRFVMEQIVNGSPDGQVRYHVVVEADQTRVSAGPAERPDITFTTDYATAAAVAQGQLSTHAALMDGRMRVGGDLTRIVDAPPDWSDLDPLPAALRAETTY